MSATGSGEGGKGAIWSKEEALCAVKLWAADSIQRMLTGSSPNANRRHENQKAYLEIGKKLAELGFPARPHSRIMQKMHRLKTEYRQLKKRMKKSGEGKVRILRHFYYFILGY